MWRHHGVRAGSNAVPMCWPVDEIVNAPGLGNELQHGVSTDHQLDNQKMAFRVHALQPRTRRRGVAHVDVC